MIERHAWGLPARVAVGPHPGQRRDGVAGPLNAGAVDRQSVFHGKARVPMVELGGRGVSLQPRGDRGERVSPWNSSGRTPLKGAR